MLTRRSRNKFFFSIYPLPDLVTPFPLKPFTTKELTCCNKKVD